MLSRSSARVWTMRDLLKINRGHRQRASEREDEGGNATRNAAGVMVGLESK